METFSKPLIAQLEELRHEKAQLEKVCTFWFVYVHWSCVYCCRHWRKMKVVVFTMQNYNFTFIVVVVELLEVQTRRQSHLGQLEVSCSSILICMLSSFFPFKGARELVLDEANQLNESKAEIKKLKETLESQVSKQQHLFTYSGCIHAYTCIAFMRFTLACKTDTCT